MDRCAIVKNLGIGATVKFKEQCSTLQLGGVMILIQSGKPVLRRMLLFFVCFTSVCSVALSQDRWYTHPDSVTNLPVTPYYDMQVLPDHSGGFYLQSPWPFSLVPYILSHFDVNGATTFPDPTYIWCYPYTSEIHGYPRSLFVLDDGSLFYSMMIQDDGQQGIIETHLMRIDQQGNQLWGPTGICESGDWRYREIARATDHSFWALRYVSASHVEDIRYGLVQYDYAGNQLFEEPIWIENQPDRSYDDYGYQLIDDKNGGVYVCIGGMRDDQWGFFINHYDADGIPADLTGLRYFDYSTGTSWNDYWVDPDGNLLVADPYQMIKFTPQLDLAWPEGSRILSQGVEYHGQLKVKFSQENGTLWVHIPLYAGFLTMKCFSPEGEQLSRFYMMAGVNSQFHVAEDGRLWILGCKKTDLHAQYFALVYARGSDGTPQDSVFLYDQPSSTASIARLCSDNRNGFEFALTTTLGSSGGLVGRVTQDGWLGFSPNETAVSDAGLSAPQSTQLIPSLYPNPTNGAVRFQLVGTSSYTISVYNILGKRVLRQFYRGGANLNEVTLNLEAHHLTSGKYFVRVVDREYSMSQVIPFNYIK